MRPRRGRRTPCAQSSSTRRRPTTSRNQTDGGVRRCVEAASEVREGGRLPGRRGRDHPDAREHAGHVVHGRGVGVGEHDDVDVGDRGDGDQHVPESLRAAGLRRVRKLRREEQRPRPRPGCRRARWRDGRSSNGDAHCATTLLATPIAHRCPRRASERRRRRRAHRLSLRSRPAAPSEAAAVLRRHAPVPGPASLPPRRCDPLRSRRRS